MSTSTLFGTRRWRLPALAVIVVLAAALMAPFVGAAPVAQGAVLRVGYLGPAGSDTANGAQLAIDQINAFGGINGVPLALVTLESAPSIETFGAALQLLTSQNVAALLGPDTNALITPDTIAALVATGVPVLTAATGDALTDVDTQNHLLRTMAPERVYGYALAQTLVEDLNVTQVVTVQTQIEFTEALMNFEASLNQAGGSPMTRVQLPSSEGLLDQVPRILGAAPEAVVHWGAPEDAAALLRALRDSGYRGLYAFRFADEAARAGLLPDELAEGVLGFSAWSYTTPTTTTDNFVRDYVIAFGQVPGPLAAAAYDAMWFLRAGMRAGGTEPRGLLSTLIALPPQTLVQGALHPIDFGNGDLARLAVVYRLGKYGGPVVLSRFDDVRRLGLQESGGPEPTPVPVTPAQTPAPTATLQGTWVEVAVNTLNVRVGPGFEFDRIGEVKLGERYRVLGGIADYTWLVIDYQGGVGWIKTEFVTVLGDLGAVSIVQAPPTPTLGPTATPPPPANPDLVIDTVTLNPAQPIPNRPFTAIVTVRNAGANAAGSFAIAATWAPGDVYTATFVNGLAGGQSTQVQLSATLTGTGVFQVGVVADLNNEVGEADETNNVYNITYRADYPPYANQTNIQLGPGTQWDLFGGTPDILWDGFNLGMLNGAVGGVLAGVTYDNVHYDLLGPGVINNPTGFGTNTVLTGAVFGIYTAEGERGVIRIDNRQGDQLWISYRVYNDTP